MLVLKEISQGSPAWFTEKLGKPSASKMDRIITSTGLVSKQAEGYMWELAAERISGLPTPTYQSQAMLEGIEKEASGRELYEFIYDVEVEQVGMIYQDECKRFLCSPDGIINREYGLEIKSVMPKTQVGYLLKNKLPTEYIVQVQSSMFISDFSRWDFISTAEGLPPLIIKVARDNIFCSKLDTILNVFCDELDEITAKLRGR